MSDLLFVHIPKNAGSSIVASIPGLQTVIHAPTYYPGSNRIDTGRLNITRRNKRFRRYRSFAVKRNPYDRFLSAYYYLYNGGCGTQLDLDAQKIIHSYRDVNHFITDLKIHMERIIHFVPQHVFICVDKKIVVNDVLEFEELTKRRKQVYGYPLLHRNKTTRDHTPVQLTRESVQMLRECYRDDFKILGYDITNTSHLDIV